MNYNFTVPVVYVPEDNNSYIGKQTINIKDCSIFGFINDECDGYNFNRCPNDDAYCQPYIPGDIIFIQLPIDLTTYESVTYQLIDSTTGLAISTGLVTEIFDYPEDPIATTKYWSLAINTRDMTNTCWYIKVSLKKSEIDDYDYVTSEPYCLVKCNEETLLIQGVYPNYDCEQHYYGDFRAGSPQNYFASYRVRGTVEPQGFAITKTTTGKQTTKSTQSERFTLFTEKVPYYVAKQIQICFNSKQLSIDGIEYKGQLKLDKNFEEGSDWIIKEDIFIDCDELNFTCE